MRSLVVVTVEGTNVRSAVTPYGCEEPAEAKRRHRRGLPDDAGHREKRCRAADLRLRALLRHRRRASGVAGPCNGLDFWTASPRRRRIRRRDVSVRSRVPAAEDRGGRRADAMGAAPVDVGDAVPRTTVSRFLDRSHRARAARLHAAATRRHGGAFRRDDRPRWSGRGNGVTERSGLCVCVWRAS